MVVLLDSGAQPAEAVLISGIHIIPELFECVDIGLIAATLTVINRSSIIPTRSRVSCSRASYFAFSSSVGIFADVGMVLFCKAPVFLLQLLTIKIVSKPLHCIYLLSIFCLSADSLYNYSMYLIYNQFQKLIIYQ